MSDMVVGKTELLTPNCGACYVRHTPFCSFCGEQLKADVDRLIVDELEKMSINTEIGPDGRNKWEYIFELLKLRHAQRNGGAEHV